MESRAAQGVLSSGHEEAASAVRRGWAELRRREEAVAHEVLLGHEVVVRAACCPHTAAARAAHGLQPRSPTVCR